MSQAFKASDLTPQERVALERLLGRSLRNDEAFELIVHGHDDLRDPETTQPANAAARIRELAKGKSIGGVTVRELIEDGDGFDRCRARCLNGGVLVFRRNPNSLRCWCVGCDGTGPACARPSHLAS